MTRVRDVRGRRGLDTWTTNGFDDVTTEQTLVTTGIVDAVAGAREIAGEKDVALMPPEHVRLRLIEAVPAPGVTHLRYEVRGVGAETS